MAPKIRHIATRFALILAFAAALPLAAFGVVSVLSLQSGTRASVVDGNRNVATRAAEEIRRYVSANAEILKSLASNLQGTKLEAWQQDRILKNYVVDFREFREITLFDEGNGMIATSRIGAPRVSIPKSEAIVLNGVSMSPIRLDKDELPTAVFAVHLTHLNRPDDWLVGEFSLEEMWRMVDQVRIGRHGYALVVAPDGTLVAHGDPDKKALVAQSRNMAGHHPLVASGKAGSGPNGKISDRPLSDPVAEYMDDNGREQLAVATRIKDLNWTVIVEQPTKRGLCGRHGAAPSAHRRDHGRAASSWSPSVSSSAGASSPRSSSCSRRRSPSPTATSKHAWTSAPRTSSASSAMPSTRWRTGSSSCRRTSSGRSGRRCSAASWEDSSTT